MITINPRKSDARSGVKVGGTFHREVWSFFNEDGSLHRNDKGEACRFLKYDDVADNLVTNQGLDHLLDVVLHATTQITAWYCVMSETNTAPAAGLTYATPSFTELQAYDEATRPAYVEAASSSQSITNSANKAVFTINGSKTLYGAGLVGGGGAASTKADAAGGGTLLCYALFAPSRAVVATDIVNLTYTFGAADDGV